MKQFVPYLFLFLFLVVLVTANIYLARRFNFYFSIENTKILFFVFPALSLLMIFGLIPLANATSNLASLVYILAAVTMGVLLYLLLIVLLVDLVRIFTNFSPNTYGIITLSATFLISLYGFLNTLNVRVTEKELRIDNLQKEVRAMHISDVHIGHLRGKAFMQQIVDKTNRQNVDVVFITGDLFDGKKHLNKDVLLPLTKLDAPVYFIEGNHDRYTGVETIKGYLRESGVNVLENEVVNWNGLQIIGLNHMRPDNKSANMHAAGNHETIQGVLGKLPVDQNKTVILLHHSPDGIEYASENGADLYLAGHTHAGQLFPIIYIAELLFKYNKGLHHFDGTKLFVSRGAGTFGPPMRVGTSSEITVLALKPGF